MSTEETAREARYDFFKKAAEKISAAKIATAHTMDDQAETVLMRFIKGSGSQGLSGIPYKRRLGKAWIIRPLLDVKREIIEKYLKKRRIPSRLDATNLKTIYLRNKLRHNLIPLLEKEFNPKIKDNLNLIAKNLGDEFDYLNSAAKRYLKRLASETKTSIAINVNGLLRQHIALQRLIVRQIIYKLKGDLKRISYKHWREIESMLYDVHKRSLDLPRGLRIIKKRGRLIFTKKSVTRELLKQLKKISKLNVPGELTIPEFSIKVRSEIAGRIPKFKKGQKRKRIEYINGDLVASPLLVRTRHKGDRMRPLGMQSSKKLHDIFVDEKIPRETREEIPLVTSGNKILWVIGVKLSEECRITKNTRKIIKLTVTDIKNK
jgi:tRNA(Ile)-lysidine synthase